MADITNANLRAALPPGITLSPVDYPDANSCLPAVMAFLQSVEQAQITQNAAAPPGEDVQLISVGQGTEQTITRNGSAHRVRQVSRTVTAFERQSVSEVFPILV